MPDDSDATPTGLAHLSTFKPGRVVFLAVAGLLLLGGAVLTAHLMQPAWLAARSDLYRIKVSQAAATFQRAPAGTEQLASAIAQMTQALQAGFSELKQQQAGSGDAVKKIAQVTLELQDGVKQLKEQHQQLQGQVQQISKQQEQLQRQADNRTRQDAAAQAAGAETAKPSPAPAARAVVPDLTPFSEPVLPGVAKQVLELDKQQAGRRVISVSLFGTSERYIQGSLENAMLARRDWPGWTYR
jgi:hypothetical protein